VLRASDVTYVTPTIPGRDELLHRAVLSVAQQRPPAHGVVVVRDSDRHGAWWARNKGLEQVDTPVVGWLDDDDRLLPNHTGVLIRAMQRTGADLVYSYPLFINGEDPLACCHNGKLVPRPVRVPFGPDQRLHLDSRDREFCPACQAWTGNFIPVTYLVRTQLVREVGGFPQPYSMPSCRASGECEDYLLLLRLLDAGGIFHHVPAVTWEYHFHDDNTGGRGADRLHELESK
jgi:hypothetical protein